MKNRKLIFKGVTIRPKSTKKIRRPWNDISKELKENNCQPRFSFPVNIKNEGEMYFLAEAERIHHQQIHTKGILKKKSRKIRNEFEQNEEN